jgi:hypothetical protein
MPFHQVIQLCHRKVRSVQLGLGQLVHEQSYRDQDFFATVDFGTARII